MTTTTMTPAAVNGSSSSSSMELSSQLICTDGGGLDNWMEEAWRTLVPMLISLAFAVFIEACLVC